MTQVVIHRDGSQEPFVMEKLIAAIRKVVDSVVTGDEAEKAMVRIITHVELKVPEQVSSHELDSIVLKAIEQFISEDPIFDDIASMQLVKMINKEIDKRFSSFSEYVTYAVKENLLSEKLLAFDMQKLESAINYDRDVLLNYFGLSELNHRYLTKDRARNVIEKPQWMWMRVAMGLSLNEQDPTAFAIRIYGKLSQLKYLHSTPTLYNS